MPLIALFIISPQDYTAHDTSPRKIDFTVRNLVKVKVCTAESLCLVKISQTTSQESLAVLHIPLYTVTHTPRRTLPDRVITLLQMFNAKQIFGNIEYEVDELRRDIKICELARPLGIKPVFRHDKCVIEPGVVTTKQGKTYTVRLSQVTFRQVLNSLSFRFIPHSRKIGVLKSIPESVIFWALLVCLGPMQRAFTILNCTAPCSSNQYRVQYLDLN